LAQTNIQGYYMHQGVGMWFTPIVLGLTYYFLPKFLNRPIYSYSLGVLAFWTQLVFYTLIGAHHFIFSAIPWWIQTTAIVFSVGMMVPVWAGTGNFLLTMRGKWWTIGRSYSVPFILVGAICYGLASTQGTLESFRWTNLYWHFTNFTIGHSHFTMYGFVAFLIWGGVYGLLPRLTGREPSILAVGVHFWFSMIGMVIYVVALSVGGTIQGRDWVHGRPFIDSVVHVAPYWLWRSVGGTLMVLSHVVFAYNLYKMRPRALAATTPEAVRA
jgi:cytochrome c oxidase cbb3-type subunit 1